MKRTIAAIIPLYNGAAFIEAAIRSVLGQDRAADELIVVDDGSTDDGAEIVRRLAREFPVIKLVTKANGGQGSARNSGVASSSADLVALLDQDDEWYPHHLRTLEQPFSEPSGVPLGWVYSNLDTIDANDRMINNMVLDTLRPNAHPKQSIFSCLGQDMFILPGASLISRAAFDKVGGFDEELVGYEDDDFFLRLFTAGFRNVYINQALTKWRMHAASTSFSEKMAISRVRYFSKLTANFPDELDTMRFYSRDYIAPRFTKTAMVELVTGIAWDDQVRIKRSYRQLVRFSRPLPAAKGRLLRAVAYLLTLQPVQIIYRAMPRRVIRRAKGALGS